MHRLRVLVFGLSLAATVGGATGRASDWRSAPGGRSGADNRQHRSGATRARRAHPPWRAPWRKGYWGAASARALVENSTNPIRMNGDGLLANLADADRVAPFRPWAKALYQYRQRTRLKDDPIGKCMPPGGPRQFLMPGGFQFVEQPALGRILVLLGGGNRNWRVIHIDGRPPEQAAEAVLTFYGTSVGRWEKDTLVVESSGYNERFWFSSGGLPHTEALRLVERFSGRISARSDTRSRLTIPAPTRDSGQAAGPVQWVANEDIQESFCEDKPERGFVR